MNLIHVDIVFSAPKFGFYKRNMYVKENDIKVDVLGWNTYHLVLFLGRSYMLLSTSLTTSTLEHTYKIEW